MPVAIKCPACGAADPGSDNGAGSHACQYCGARYRLDSTGHVHAVVSPQGGAAGLVIASLGAVFTLAFLGAIIAYLAIAAEPDEPPPGVDIDLSGVFEAAALPSATPLSGVGVAIADVTPEPTPVVAAEFVEHSQRTSSDGALWILGMLTNTGEIALDTTEVIAVFRDAQGGEVGTDHGYSKRDVLAPGEASPVQILVKTAPEHASITYEVDADKPSWLPERVEGLRVEAGPLQDEGWGLKMDGKVHHDGTVPAKFVEIEVQAWDADDKLVGIESSYAKGDVLQPGSSARWSMIGLQTAAKPARLEMFVEGRKAD